MFRINTITWRNLTTDNSAIMNNFVYFDLLDTVVMDNKTCLLSSELEKLLLENNIYQWKAAPYHLASNGLAKRAVQILKQGLRKIKNRSIEEKLGNLFFNNL